MVPIDGSQNVSIDELVRSTYFPQKGKTVKTQRERKTRRITGTIATFAGLTMLVGGFLVPAASADLSTQLVAEPGQTPMPSAVTAVPENCNGIAPTPGSANDTTQKQLNEGQGLVTTGPNSLEPGGTVHWLIGYNATDKSASFDIRDCVVEFLPGNQYVDDVLALIDPAGHGQIIPTPGSTPAIKGYDNVVDNAQFAFPDNVALPGEFDLSWTVPANATPGTLICNYAKDTGGSEAGGNENRKAGGACFTVASPSTTTTAVTPAITPEVTTTTAPTTTTAAPTTTSTQSAANVAGASVTTVPTQVLGEQFNKGLAFTGGSFGGLLTTAGALILTGGVLALAADRRRRRNR